MPQSAGDQAAARTDELTRRLAELEAGDPVTTKNAQLAQHAQEARARAECAHRSAAHRYDQSAALHEQTAQIHERAQAAHVGDATTHQHAVEIHRAAARRDRLAAQADRDRADAEESTSQAHYHGTPRGQNSQGVDPGGRP
jgi:hypothetical protein